MDIIIVGGFHEIIELAEECRYNIVGIIDNQLNKDYYGYPILGRDSDAENLFKKYNYAKVIITPDKPLIRMNLVNIYSKIGYGFCNMISPLSRISKTSKIGVGTIVQDFVNISANCCLGSFIKLNTYSNIMHDVIIDDFTTIAPNAVALGRVNIWKNCYFGSNSTILPDRIIKNGSIVGAGAVVTKDVLENEIVKGVPAK